MSLMALYDWWRGKNEAPMPGATPPATEPALRQEQFAPVKQTDRLEIQRNVVTAIKKGRDPAPEDLEALGIRTYEGEKRDFLLKNPGHFDKANTRVLLVGTPTRTRSFYVTLYRPEAGLADEVVPLYDKDPVSDDEYARAVDIAAQNRVAGSVHKVTLLYP